MSTIAIVGAGKGYGLSLGKVFGQNGYNVALIARCKEHVEELSATLSDLGIQSKGFVADVRDGASLKAALEAAKGHFGSIDVLEYSPVANHTPPSTVTQNGREKITDHIDYLLLGGATAVDTVLPDMLAAKSGAILFTTGLSALEVLPGYGSVSVAGAAIKRYVELLNKEVGDQGVFAGLIALGLVMRPKVPAGNASHPDIIAQHVYELLQKREQPINRYPKNVTPDTILWNREYKED